MIVKATAGGGGRGMRMALNRAELEKLYPVAYNEALSCFVMAPCIWNAFYRPKACRSSAFG